jgi:hypothetical protein
MPKPGDVRIPKTPLGRDLDRAASLKLEAIQLMRELEAAYTKTPPAHTGAWRHNPLAWMKRHRP